MPIRRRYATVISAWLILVAGYASVYVLQRINSPDAEGYERDWQFQLVMFSIVRLPFLLLGLGVALWTVPRRGRPNESLPQ